MMRVSTPQVLWHGGGNENGKPDPVYSIDFHPSEQHILCSSGIDASVPPRGSVRVSFASLCESIWVLLLIFVHHYVLALLRFGKWMWILVPLSVLKIFATTILRLTSPASLRTAVCWLLHLRGALLYTSWRALRCGRSSPRLNLFRKSGYGLVWPRFTICNGQMIVPFC